MKELKTTSWLNTNIGDCTIILDNQRKPVNSNERAKRPGDIPYYGATGQVGMIDDYLFDEELVLLGEDGAPFFDKQKNVAYQISGKSWVNNHAHVLKAKAGITINKYLLYYFNYFDYNGFVGGSTRLKLTQESLRTIPISLPSIAEQKRIVKKLDDTFQHLKIINEKLTRIPELLEKFRLNILNHAITGKLTADWRDTNLADANEIIENLKHDILDSKQLIFFADIEEIPFDIPEQWTFAYLGALAEKVTYGTSVKSENEGDIPVLRMGNLQKGNIDWTDLKYTSDPKELKKYRLNRGDVLFNRTNSPELVGKTSVYESDDPAIYAGYLMKIWNKPELNSYYLNYLLNSAYARNWCWEVKTDGVSQSNINAQKLLKFIVPLPPLDEQALIVAKLNKLFESTEMLTNQHESFKQKIGTLPQVLLKKAFRGELVSPDENDEPTSELLKKIKIETTTSALENPKKKNASKSMKPKKETQLLIERLKSVSEKNEFTFDDIRKLSGASYIDLKEELYSLLDSSLLEMIFDERKELMVYKLATDETS
jgi:type I restriction enzyme S subunit